MSPIRRAALLAALLLAACGGGGSEPQPPPPECSAPADCGTDTTCLAHTCTGHVCDVSYAAVDTACAQDGGSFCDGTGGCVACNAPAQCSGADDECGSRTCIGNACGMSFAVAGTIVSSQTAGDCQQNQCDGSGAVVSVDLNSDHPADDGNACTDDTCSAGVPVHPALAIDTACNQGGGSFCDGSGLCVPCNAAAQCPGTDTECHTRTCDGNACGTANVSAGHVVSTQTPGDCQQNQCDGNGAIVSVALNSDHPADDGNPCTDDTCSAGAPVHPALAIDTPCNQGGGAFCDGAGACVACNTPTECPGSDTECRTRTCNSNACGFSFATAGTVVASQVAGDCHENQCNGAGAIVNATKNEDVLVDGNPCTADLCSAGVPTNPAVAAGTACPGGVCNGTGSCIPRPAVSSTSPASGSTVDVPTPIAVTFTAAMNPATLTAQTSSGACSGSIQLSTDDFASCTSFGSAAVSMTGGDTVATLVPVPGLLVNRSYKIRVTAAASSALGVAMASSFTSSSPFVTQLPACVAPASAVISQIYGGGGNAGATYKNDFIELHNRGAVPLDVTGWTVQYATAAGATWTATSLTGTIPAGGYYLVKEASGGGGTVDLSGPDVTGSTQLGAAAGKVALVSSLTALTGTCPASASIVDFVGYGAGATCTSSGGANAAPAPGDTTAVFRYAAGCADTDVDSGDFTAAAPAPRNTASAALACGCASRSVNETGVAAEADYCTVISPVSMSVAAGALSAPVVGQVFEDGITGMGTASAAVTAQLGYGPPTANPEYEAGWSWVAASYTGIAGNRDEYAASFTAPASGDYRYAYRFSLDVGQSWTYCDGYQADSGAGSNPGLTFDLVNLPVLTVP